MNEEDNVVLYSVDGAVACITLNRPDKRNALNDLVIGGIKQALRAAGEDDSVRVVVIKGAGADLAELQKISKTSIGENLKDAQSLMELFTLMRKTSVPIVAAVHGRALAGGCGLATACDIVLASESARFGYPEVNIGFVPAMVMAILRRSVSEKRAFELVTLGADFSAEEAVAFGLANHVFDDEVFASE